MGNNLDGLTQVVSPALFVDNALVDASGCNVVGLGGLDAQEPLVVSQVEVGLMSIHGDVALPVFVWVESTRVDVDVRVELLDGHFIPSCLKQFADGGGNDAFA